MATYAEIENESELTPREFVLARKQTMLRGHCDMWLYDKANFQQRYAIHQIELTVKSITEEDLEEEEEVNN
jgi:hypothetical protein